MSENEWERYGLPNECPECGEDTNLSAFVVATEKTDDGERAIAADIRCESGLRNNPGKMCLNTWRWEAEGT